MGALSILSKPMLRAAVEAYHGSPRAFERFMMSKVGTGEKAQAFGHGLYFAQNPLTAASYRNALESGAPLTGPVRTARKLMDMFGGDRDRATQEALGHLADWHSTSVQDQIPGADRMLSDAIEHIQRRAEFPGGKMYKVDINASPDDFLDWHKPIDPSDPRADAINKLVVDAGRRRMISLRPPVESGTTVGKMYGDLADVMPTFNTVAAEREASKRLSDIGVPGIKYLDQMSRQTGEGTHNYSVFDDSLLNIKDRYKHGGRVSSFKVKR